MYQIPVEISNHKSLSISAKWIVNNARSRKDTYSMDKKFYLELLDIYLMRGKTIKKKEETQKIINNNKVFSSRR